MKRLPRLCIILTFALFAHIGSIHALEIKDKNEYLIDIRGDDGDIYRNYFSIHKKVEPVNIEGCLFAESQWNFEINEWEKLTVGLEAGKFLSKYLYAGQSLQFTTGEILDYMAFEGDSNTIDATTKLSLELPFFKNFVFHTFEEWSLNLEKGRDEYCETGVELIYKASDLYSLGIGWRHTDRVHTLDTDYASTFFTLDF